MSVMTVWGEIPVANLGVTQMHEHVLANADASGSDFNLVMDDVEVAAAEVAWFRRAGGRTLVDLTCPGLGRNAAGLKTVTERTGVQIVAATGLYLDWSYPDYVARETAEQLAERMIRDCREGMDGTSVRAGILAELATNYGRGAMSAAEEKVFTAAAYAQRATGLPVSTHCWAGELGHAQLDVLMRHGVPPQKVIIGHLAVDPQAKARVYELAERGVFLGIDCIGYEYERVVAMKDREKAVFVRELIERGFRDQITISQDLVRKLLLKHYHGIGYDYLLLRFVPLLEAAGVSRADVEAILVDSPRRVFA